MPVAAAEETHLAGIGYRKMIPRVVSGTARECSSDFTMKEITKTVEE